MDTITPDLVSEVESAPTIGRTSGRSARVEVLARAERRRSWTLEQKREIVSESLGPELTPTDVARKHGVSTGQIYTWGHQLLSFRRPGCRSRRSLPPWNWGRRLPRRPRPQLPPAR